MSTNNASPANVEQAKARFSQERDKRLRSDAANQYVNVSGDMAKDPWMERQPREAVKDHVTVTFVGGGWAGLITGAELAKKGISDVRIIDRAGDFGGVWYWNRYPGLMCDSPALIYLPLLEETGHVPTEKYVHQPEILEHAKRIGRHFDLYDKALFHTEISGVRWDQAQQIWHVKTDRDDEFTTDFLCLGTGFLSTPKLPKFPGVERFKGKSFHAARWDYNYTGGSPEQPLSKLADKRVAVIGTGASAIQLVNPTSASAKELYVFQRTPSAVHPRNNAPMNADYFKSIAKPGWQRVFNQDMVMNFAGILGQPYNFEPTKTLFEGDAFSEIFNDVRNVIMSIPPEQRNLDNVMSAIEAHDVETVAKNHAHVDGIVSDSDTANDLKPWYRTACKRPTFNDDYLASFNRLNTHLVGTDGKGVTEITEQGVVANGKEYPVDCIIFASGFDFAKDLLHCIQFDIEGVEGKKLQQHWQDGVRTFHGMHVNGFPNMFMIQLAQGADFAPNIPTGWQHSAEVIANVVSHMQTHKQTQVMADAEYETAWTKLICDSRPPMDPSDCTPGLLTHEGSTDPKLASLQGYPDGPRAFFEMIQSWQTTGQFEGLTFS